MSFNEPAKLGMTKRNTLPMNGGTPCVSKWDWGGFWEVWLICFAVDILAIAALGIYAVGSFLIGLL